MTTQLLDADDRNAIDAALQRLEDAKPELERAKMADIDVSEAEGRMRETETKLRKIKAAFFPT